MGTRWLRRSILVAGAGATPFFLVKAYTGRSTGDTVPPRVVIDQELSHDFGVARLGAGGHHAWTVRNTGRRELELWLDKGPACGCTVTSLAKGRRERIPPGGSMEIAMEWRARKGINEAFAQSATIGTNDPARPDFTLRISGWIHAPIVTAPEMVNLTPIYNGETRRADVAVFSPDRPDLAISEIVSSRPELIAVAMKPLKPDGLARLKARAGYRLGIEIRPGMPEGWLSETLLVRTNHPDRPTLNIPITGVVTGTISFAPTRLSLPIAGGREGVSRHVMLMVRDGRETCFDVVHKPGAVAVSIAPAAAPAGRRRYRLTVTTIARDKSGRGSDSIILRTDHPKSGEVEIPVHFAARRGGLPTTESAANAAEATR